MSVLLLRRLMEIMSRVPKCHSTQWGPPSKLQRKDVCEGCGTEHVTTRWCAGCSQSRMMAVPPSSRPPLFASFPTSLSSGVLPSRSQLAGSPAEANTVVSNVIKEMKNRKLSQVQVGQEAHVSQAVILQWLAKKYHSHNGRVDNATSDWLDARANGTLDQLLDPFAKASSRWRPTSPSLPVRGGGLREPGPVRAATAALAAGAAGESEETSSLSIDDLLTASQGMRSQGILMPVAAAAAAKRTPAAKRTLPEAAAGEAKAWPSEMVLPLPPSVAWVMMSEHGTARGGQSLQPRPYQFSPLAGVFIFKGGWRVATTSE